MNSILERFVRLFLRFGCTSFIGRQAFRVAAMSVPVYKGARALASMTEKGYIAYSAKIFASDLSLGKHSFIGDGAVIYQNAGGGKITLGERSSLNQYCTIETGEQGSVVIGKNTHIQQRCQLSAYKGSISIGDGVQMAPNCALYPYNHGFSTHEPIMKQPLSSKGGIVIEDDVWLSYGVVVLDGVRIGKGAVIGASAVVTSDIPAGAIAAGIPAKVKGMRQDERAS